MNLWGMSATVDVHNCDPATMRSREMIQDYVLQLCKMIKMERHGDLIIEHFGDGNKEGYSMVQLIETSCITGHFANESNSIFIDIFSCKEFDVLDVAAFTHRFFDGDRCSHSTKNRYSA